MKRSPLRRSSPPKKARAGYWIPQREKQPDCCTENLPYVEGRLLGDTWVRPSCHRRWRYVTDPKDPMRGNEGRYITGPDGALFWRPFRARFIGRLGL